jgi:Mg2+ and Co2+ transporter CorA
MATAIYRNGSIKEGINISEKSLNVVGYLYNSDNLKKTSDKVFTNIHKDIIIRSKEMIFLKIPVVIDGSKVIVDAVIDKDEFILNYESEILIEFLKEKISLHEKIDKNMLCLFLFQYFSYLYTEELLSIEERVDDLFQEAVYKGNADNKEILEIKKSVSLIKRFTSYYKSMLTYLDDEFGCLDIYNKVLLVLDNTLNLVDNIEASIYSCIDIYNSELSNKMNKTMQLLTVITVSTLPLTIVSGIFGMNFQNMPLLNSSNGFIVSIGITLIIVLLELIYFKRNNYL